MWFTIHIHCALLARCVGKKNDGVWVYPAPTEQAILEAAAAGLPDTPEPASLFRLTPVAEYINKDTSLRNLRSLLQTRPNNQPAEQENSTWHKKVIKDSTTKATRAKQIRDLTIENKRIIVQTTTRPFIETIHDFFKKKGIHYEEPHI